MKINLGHGLRRWRDSVLLLALLMPLLAACGAGAAPEAASTTTASVAPASSAPAAASPATETATESATESATTAASPEASAAPTEEATATAEAVASPSPAATEPAGAASTNPNIPQQLQYGVVTQLYYTDAVRVVTLADLGGFDWVRQQVPWKDTEPPDRTFGFQELDRVVDVVAAQNKKLLLSIVKSPDWATGRPGDNGLPNNPDDYARFVREVATRYKGRVQAIEVWNEQNLAVENGGRVAPEDASRYVELLKRAYTAIKEVDPTIVVVAGALSSTGVTEINTAVDDITYLKAMYEYNGGEIKNYMDAQGYHPAAALNPPDTLYPDAPGPGCANGNRWCDSRTHYFRHIEDVRQVMLDNGLSDKQVWITEMGWATENDTPGYEYGNEISLEQQADYLEGALFRIQSQYDYVGVAFIWNLNFAVTWGQAGNPIHEQASFGLLNPDYSPRPAFSRVQGFINAAKQNQ